MYAINNEIYFRQRSGLENRLGFRYLSLPPGGPFRNYCQQQRLLRLRDTMSTFLQALGSYREIAGYAYRMECNFLLTRISSKVYHVFVLLFKFYILDNIMYNIMLNLTRINNNLTIIFPRLNWTNMPVSPFCECQIFCNVKLFIFSSDLCSLLFGLFGKCIMHKVISMLHCCNKR
jgi:hypothetical protein